jgi:uncharacterized protein (TIGR02118 family)
MIKLMVVVRRRKDLTHQEFRTYYETRHAPLAQKLFPQISHYRRSYVVPGTVRGSVGIASVNFDYDVVTEMGFADQAAFDAFLATAAQPEMGAQMAMDEAQFMDRGSIALFRVDEGG